MSPNSSSTGGRRRRASHAGSWYTQDGRQLRHELDQWLSRVDTGVAAPASSSANGSPPFAPARAIIGPHAGYRYCGACGAHAYRQIDPRRVKRVFILGPSHHVRLSGCAVSGCQTYQTPLYDLTIDQEVNQELLATGEFETMTLSADEDEHSIEMHLPYVARVMDGHAFTVVPIMVGSLSMEKEAKYGRLLAKYLDDPENFFVISSDFCHWGQRFHYTHYDEKCGQIHESIKALDYMGMDLIETLDHAAFSHYLKKYNNTICGRHPIGVLLGAIEALRGMNGSSSGKQMRMKFLNYDQSNACKSYDDSSVSYAAATFTIG